MKDTGTKKPRSNRAPRGMRAEYGCSGGIHAKYATRYRAGVNVVLFAPEVTGALRALLAIAARTKVSFR